MSDRSSFTRLYIRSQSCCGGVSDPGTILIRFRGDVVASPFVEGDGALFVALKYLDDVIFFPSGVTEDGDSCCFIGVMGNTSVVGSLVVVVVVVVVKYLDFSFFDMAGNADDCSDEDKFSNRWISIAFVPETGRP